VACRTLGGRKARGNVIRYVSSERSGALPGSLMTPVTIRVRRCERVVVSDMAIGAHYDFPRGLQLVRTGKRPTRRAVIKGGGGPGNRVVAG